MHEKTPENLERAVSQVQGEAQCRGLLPSFQRYREQGNARAPVHYNILVNPTLPLSQESIKKGIEKGFSKGKVLEWAMAFYKLMLNFVITSPDTTIVMNRYTKVGIGRIEVHNKILNTLGDDMYLYPQELINFFEFTKGINPYDAYTIHGASRKICPTIFATQLYIASQLDGYIGKDPSGGIQTHSLESQRSILTLYNSGIFKNGPVRTGIQYNTEFMAFTNVPSYQFMDTDSIFIPSFEEVKKLTGK